MENQITWALQNIWTFPSGRDGDPLETLSRGMTQCDLCVTRSSVGKTVGGNPVRSQLQSSRPEVVVP